MSRRGEGRRETAYVLAQGVRPTQSSVARAIASQKSCLTAAFLLSPLTKRPARSVQVRGAAWTSLSLWRTLLLTHLNDHRLFGSGSLWGINSFDQWGVELGKRHASAVEAGLASGRTEGLDAATAGLVRRLR